MSRGFHIYLRAYSNQLNYKLLKYHSHLGPLQICTGFKRQPSLPPFLNAAHISLWILSYGTFMNSVSFRYYNWLFCDIRDQKWVPDLCYIPSKENKFGPAYLETNSISFNSPVKRGVVRYTRKGCGRVFQAT